MPHYYAAALLLIRYALLFSPLRGRYFSLLMLLPPPSPLFYDAAMILMLSLLLLPLRHAAFYACHIFMPYIAAPERLSPP